jgi:tyrosyl-tRNA synthetase
MSIPDTVMPQWATLVTDWSAEETAGFLTALADGAVHPMEGKKRLAHRIVELYHGVDAADAAQHDFEQTFQQGGQPAALSETTVVGPVGLIDLLVHLGAAASKSAARRLIGGGGVSLDGAKVTSTSLVLDHAATIQVGPRRVYRVSIA